MTYALAGTGGVAGVSGVSGIAGTGTGTQGDGASGIQSDAGSVRLDVLNQSNAVIRGGNGLSGGAGIQSAAATFALRNLAGATIQGGAGASTGAAGILLTAGNASITNLGTILPGSGAGAGAYGIMVSGGSFTTLTNAQGGNTPLTYSGNLPTQYNIVINSPTNFGKLQVTNSGTSQTTIGIDSTSVLNRSTLSYQAVLSGVNSSQLANTADSRGWWGSFSQPGAGRGLWKLQADSGSSSVWDLIFMFGPDSDITRAALAANASALRTGMDRRISDLAFSADHDCKHFNQDKICLSFSARQTRYDIGNASAGVLTAAYRSSPHWRVGAFVDQGSKESGLNNVRLDNTQPLYGAFVGYDQNQGLGLQARAVTAVKRGDVVVTRDGSGAEPGSGKASLNASMVSAELGWGFALAASSQVTPFASLRYSKATRGAYQETLVDNQVDYPIAYGNYFLNLTTLSAGARINGAATEKVSYQFTVGAESHLRQNNGDYSGTSTISDLESFAMTTMGVSKRTRAFASASIAHQLAKNQQLSASFSLRSQPYTGQRVSSAMVGYRISF